MRTEQECAGHRGAGMPAWRQPSAAWGPGHVGRRGGPAVHHVGVDGARAVEAGSRGGHRHRHAARAVDPGDSVQYFGRERRDACTGEHHGRRRGTAHDAWHFGPGSRLSQRRRGQRHRDPRHQRRRRHQWRCAARGTADGRDLCRRHRAVRQFRLEGHRARRSPARAAGHAVWLGLARGQRALHHEQAGLQGVQRLGQPELRHDRRLRWLQPEPRPDAEHAGRRDPGVPHECRHDRQ